MATEQEELRLTVTLADNASAGLEKLQAQLKELGGGGGAGGNKHVEKLNEGTKALTETVIKMTGSFGEAFKSLGMLRLGFIGGIAGLAAFGYEMAKQIKDLGEYTDKIRHLGQLGKDIGVDPSAIKNIAEQLKVFGVSTEQSEAALTRFAQRMAELQRDPRVRFNILGTMTAQTPQAQAAMQELLDSLDKATDIYEKLNIVRQAYENFRQNALKRGETEERAADEARQGVAALGYSAELSRAGVLKRLSDEEKKAWAEKQAAAEHYSDTLGRIAGNLESIAEIQKESLTGKDSWATYAAEQFERFTAYFLDLEKHGGLQGIYKRALKGDEDPGMTQPSFEDRWPAPGAPEFKKRLEGPGPRLQNQSYRGMGMDGSLLHQAAFVSEEQKKGVDANTEQLKRLNDLLMQAMGLSGTTGAGGGFQNAAFTTGGGFGGGGLGGTTPRSFGGGGYRNLGTTYGGGDAGVNGGAAGTPRMTQGRREVAQIAAKALRAGGMNENMIAGIFANIGDESGFNPNLRHPDQPHYGGEAHYAHGLYQEGGAEWNNYSAWIAKEHPGGNWRDPALQSKFLAQRMKTGYASTWKKMQNARSPGEAAAIFVNEYLKPAAGYRSSRMAKYLRGVPGVGAYTGSDKVASSEPQVPPSPPTAADQPPPTPELTPEALKAYGERRLMHNPGDLTRENLLAHARRQMDADQNGTTKVEGSGKIRVDVNAPKGTSVSAESSGLFKTIETYRQTQMEHAERGPPRWGTPQ